MSNVQAHEFCGIKGWPICAVCQKPVERMEAFDDINSFTRTYRAFCHGAIQQVALTDLALISATEIRFEKAFDNKKLEHQS